MGPNAFLPKLGHRPGVDTHGRRYDPELRHAIVQLCGHHPDPLASETLQSVLGVTRSLLDHLEASMTRNGLSMSRYSILVRLWQTEGTRAPLNEIARWCNVSPRNVTGLVDGLAAAGLVERIAQNHDRRVTLARLTPAGARLIERVSAEHWAEQAQLLSGLGEGDRRTLIDLCIRLGSQVAASRPDGTKN